MIPKTVKVSLSHVMQYHLQLVIHGQCLKLIQLGIIPVHLLHNSVIFFIVTLPQQIRRPLVHNAAPKLFLLLRFSSLAIQSLPENIAWSLDSSALGGFNVKVLTHFLCLAEIILETRFKFFRADRVSVGFRVILLSFYTVLVKFFQFPLLRHIMTYPLPS